MASKTVLLDSAAKVTVSSSVAIAKCYVRRIHRGDITIDDVPWQIRDMVQGILDEEK